MWVCVLILLKMTSAAVTFDLLSPPADVWMEFCSGDRSIPPIFHLSFPFSCSFSPLLNFVIFLSPGVTSTSPRSTVRAPVPNAFTFRNQDHPLLDTACLGDNQPINPLLIAKYFTVLYRGMVQINDGVCVEVNVDTLAFDLFLVLLNSGADFSICAGLFDGLFSTVSFKVQSWIFLAVFYHLFPLWSMKYYSSQTSLLKWINEWGVLLGSQMPNAYEMRSYICTSPKDIHIRSIALNTKCIGGFLILHFFLLLNESLKISKNIRFPMGFYFVGGEMCQKLIGMLTAQICQREKKMNQKSIFLSGLLF